MSAALATFQIKVELHWEFKIDSYISHIRMRYFIPRPLNTPTAVIVYALILKQTRVNPNADTDVIEHRDVKQGGFVVISISQNQEHIVVKPSSERKKQHLLIINYFWEVSFKNNFRHLLTEANHTKSAIALGLELWEQNEARNFAKQNMNIKQGVPFCAWPDVKVFPFKTRSNAQWPCTTTDV